MKLAPVLLAGRAAGVDQLVVHTGQHYDRDMSDRFFDDLGIPHPDENLDVGSGTHAVQTATIMTRFEPVLLRVKPDWVVVYGDVNSTMAATLVAVEAGGAVAHVEAGLRSRDRAMPEEINRIVTDQLADLLLPPSRDGIDKPPGRRDPEERIVFVGNVMVDTLLRSGNRPGRPGLRGRLGCRADPTRSSRCIGPPTSTRWRPSPSCSSAWRISRPACRSCLRCIPGRGSGSPASA
jgi:UDP-N-acetylglucosamine 2-epimerase (non-hydrolysing)